MSTTSKTTPSAIPRAFRAASLATNGPRPTKSSLLRASCKQASSQPDDSKATLAKPRASARENLARADELLAKIAAKRRETMVVQQKTAGSPSGIPTPRTKAVGPTGVAGERRNASHSMPSRSVSLPSHKVSTAAASSIPPPSSYMGSRGCRQLLQEVGASMAHQELVQVSTLRSCVKKVNSTVARNKQVHWGISKSPKVYILDAGERPPWTTDVVNEYKLRDGEIGWEEWREQQVETAQTFDDRELALLLETEPELVLATENKVANELMLEDLALTIEIDDELASMAMSLFSAKMAVFLEELEAEEAESAARGEDSEWSIFIFGGNPMLQDETLPFSLDDEVFDEILNTMINLEEEKQDALTKQAARLALCFDADLTRHAAEVKDDEEGLTSGDQSSWNLYEYGGNSPSLFDEPMPFSLPKPHPDTTFELGDLSVLPADDMSLLIDEKEPHLRDVLANIPEWWVPEPEPQDFANMALDLLALANQGITASDTDVDLCGRLQRGLTGFISTKEEDFFAMPIPMVYGFERRFEVLHGSEAMITDEQYPGDVSILEGLGADDTMLPIDTDPIIQQRLRLPNLLAELATMPGPGFLCAALMD